MKNDMVENSTEGLYLTFRLAEEEYGLPVLDVLEIVGMVKLTELPDSSEYLTGVIDLRGSILPVIDLRSRLGLPRGQYDDRTSIIVVSHETTRYGVIVDRVNDVVDFEVDGREATDNLPDIVQNSFVSRIGRRDDHITLLLSTRDLLGTIDDVADMDADSF